MEVDPFKASVEPVLEQAIHSPWQFGWATRLSVTDSCVVRHVAQRIRSHDATCLPHASPVSGSVFFFKKYLCRVTRIFQMPSCDHEFKVT